MNEYTCPFCLQTIPTAPGFSGHVFAHHNDEHGKTCRGWGKSVNKAKELYAAVRELLDVIEKRLNEAEAQS